MRRNGTTVRRIGGLVILALACSAVARAEIAADDARIKALASDDEKARRQASASLTEVGAEAVPALVSQLGKANPTVDKMAFQTLFHIVQKAPLTESRDQVARHLIAGLTWETPVPVRKKIFRLLSYIGQRDAADAMYKFLSDVDSQEMARWSIARLQTPNATQALVGAMQLVAWEFRVGLINAMGERRDAQAIPVLRLALQSDDEAMREAALAALSRMGHPMALRLIMEAVESGAGGARASAVSALLDCGETFADAGGDDKARSAFRMTCELPDISAIEFCRAVHGLGRVGTTDDAKTILAGLNDPQRWGAKHRHVEGACLAALVHLPGKEVTDLLAKAIGVLEGSQKADLVHVLGRRDATMTNEGREALVEAIGDEDDNIQREAVQAVRTAGLVDAVPALVAVLGDQDEVVIAAAQRALCHMDGEEVTARLIEAMEKSSNAIVKARAVEALGYRRGSQAIEAMIEAGGSESIEVRAAAAQAIGVAQASQGLDLLLKLLTKADSADYAAAEEALQRLTDPSVTEKLMHRYDRSSVPQRQAILRTLAHRRAEGLDELLMRETKQEDPAIRAAAATGLGILGDARYDATLEKLADEGPSVVTEAALAGYLAAARRHEADDRARAAQMYVKAYSLAERFAQTCEALDGIGRTAGPEYVELLPAILPMLIEEEVPPAAARAAGRLAIHLPNDRLDEAQMIVETVVRLIPRDPMAVEFVKKLRARGGELDVPFSEGFITRWWLAGPFPIKNEMDWSQCDIEGAVPRLSEPIEVHGEQYAWQPYHLPDPRGIVVLEDALAHGYHVGAYAYAEMTVRDAQEVALRIGSDDFIAVWLNGQRVHAHQVNRAVVVDNDVVAAKLRAGVNRILVKVTNGGGGWGFCMRVTSPEGRFVYFQQKMPKVSQDDVE